MTNSNTSSIAILCWAAPMCNDTVVHDEHGGGKNDADDGYRERGEAEDVGGCAIHYSSTAGNECGL